MMETTIFDQTCKKGQISTKKFSLYRYTQSMYFSIKGGQKGSLLVVNMSILEFGVHFMAV